MKNNSTKYYVYLRKSSEGEDRQVQSIERQDDEVKKLINYYSLNVVGTFHECRSARTPNNRPEFTRMVAGIRKGTANGIICWHINRLARNPLESGIIQQLLEEGRIKSIITKDREYTGADNAIIFSVESSLATQYSKDLSKMIKSGMERKVNQGIFPSKAPLGYLNTKKAEHGSNYIIKDPDKFELVRRLWDMMLTRMYTPPQIVDKTKKESLLRSANLRDDYGRDLPLSTLYWIFHNPFYAGYFTYNGKVYVGKHEPMISSEEFDLVQKILGSKQSPKYQKHKFAYTGTMKCNECGSAITATEKVKLIKTTGLYGAYVYYYCSGRKKGTFCTSRKRLTLSCLEAMIEEQIERISVSKKFVDIASGFIQQNVGEFSSQDNLIQSEREKKIELLRRQVNNLLIMRVNNEIDEGVYKKEKLDRENQILILKQKLLSEEDLQYQGLKGFEANLKQLLNLKDKFISGTKTVRKQIFLNIGENHSLLGKELIITKANWLNTLAKYKKDVEIEISKFELEKHVDFKVFYDVFKHAFPTLSTLIEEVRTINEEEIKSFRIKID